MRRYKGHELIESRNANISLILWRPSRVEILNYPANHNKERDFAFGRQAEIRHPAAIGNPQKKTF